MRLPDFRLSTRIAIIGLAFVAAGAMALLLIEDTRLRDEYLRGQRVNLEGELQFQKLRLSRDIVHLRQDALFLSRTHPVSGIMRAVPERGKSARDSGPRETWEARLRYIFAAFLEAHPDYTSLRYIGVADGGREIVRVDNRAGKIEITPPYGLQTRGDRAYFNATLRLRVGQVHLSEFGADQERGATEPIRQIALHAATPVFAPSGQIFGMVVIETGAARLLEPIALDLPPGVLAYAADAGGQYLFHPDAQKRFGFEPGGKNNVTADFPFLGAIFDPRAAEHFPFQADAPGEPKHYLAAERVHFDPDDPARFLLFAYHLPGAVAARQMVVVSAGSITAGLMVLMLAGGIALFALRRIFVPLERIASAADAIAAGGRDVALPQNGIGEIGVLANALSIMLAKLLQREEELRRINAELEDRVKGRVLDLELAQIEAGALLRRNQALLQTSIDGIHIMDGQGNLLEANDAFYRMLGYTREEAAHLNVADWNAQFTGEELRAQFENIIGKSASIETVHRSKGGALIDVEISAAGVEIDGQFFVFASARDITERKKAQIVLQRHHLVVGAALDGFWMTSVEGVLQEVNEAYAKMSGYTAQELVGMRISQLEAREREGDVRAHIAEIIARGYDRFETRHRHKDGHEIDVEVSVTYLKEARQFFAFCRDITERKRAEEALFIAAAAFETQDAIMITDAGGNIIRVNRAFSAITGYSPEEVLGKNQDMMNSGQDGQGSCIEMLQQSIRDGSWGGEVYDKRKNGQVYPKWMTVTAVKNERREITHYVTIFSDITARKQTEESRLRESEERFRGTLEQVAVGIAHTTIDGNFRQVNQKFCAITGYARDELLQMNYRDITFPDDLDKNIRYRQQLFAGEINTFSMEKRYVCKDRRLVWVSLTVSLLRDACGLPQYTIGVIEDITGRKQAEALVQQFGSLLQSSFNEIYIFDAHTLHFLLTSEGAEQNLGYSSGELNELTPLDIKPLFTRESFEQLLAPLRSGEEALLSFEAVHRRKDGTTYPVEARMQYMESDYPVFMAVIQDISERKHSERQLRDLSAHIQNVREEEKTDIAREIHDDLGGTLTALKMDVYWLAGELCANKEAAPLLGHIESMSQLLDNAVSVTRRVITDLRPTVLDDLGLRAALEYQAGQFQKRTGIQCRVTGSCADDCKNELDKTQAINLFRIFQESLTNVARHSGASSVEAELQCDEGEIILTVSDNGCGLPEGRAVAATSFGMIGMRERALQLGGRINFYSPPGGGFSVTVILPLLSCNQKEDKT